jgi:large subunit ribosomal protein L18Ae
MVKAKENTNNIHQFLVVGRGHPTESNPTPKIFKMRIFANDAVRAKSKFWYFLKRMNKIKKTNGEILSVHEVWGCFYYRCSKETHLKLKLSELFALTNQSLDITPFTRNSEALALMEQLINYVTKLLTIDSEMAGRHKAQRESLVIVRTTEIAGDLSKNSKRSYTAQIVKEGIKFPQLQRKLRPARKTFRTVFKATRPNLFS